MMCFNTSMSLQMKQVMFHTLLVWLPKLTKKRKKGFQLLNWSAILYVHDLWIRMSIACLGPGSRARCSFICIEFHPASTVTVAEAKIGSKAFHEEMDETDSHTLWLASLLCLGCSNKRFFRGSLYNETQFSCKYVYNVSIPVQNKEEHPNSGQHFATSSFDEKNNFCHQLFLNHVYFMGSRLCSTCDTASDDSSPSFPLLSFLPKKSKAFVCNKRRNVKKFWTWLGDNSRY